MKAAVYDFSEASGSNKKLSMASKGAGLSEMTRLKLSASRICQNHRGMQGILCKMAKK